MIPQPWINDIDDDQVYNELYEQYQTYVQENIEDEKNQILQNQKNINQQVDQVKDDIKPKRKKKKRNDSDIDENSLQILNLAATIIQKVWRGYNIRRLVQYYFQLYAEQNEENDNEDKFENKIENRNENNVETIHENLNDNENIPIQITYQEENRLNHIKSQQADQWEVLANKINQFQSVQHGQQELQHFLQTIQQQAEQNKQQLNSNEKLLQLNSYEKQQQFNSNEKQQQLNSNEKQKQFNSPPQTSKKSENKSSSKKKLQIDTDEKDQENANIRNSDSNIDLSQKNIFQKRVGGQSVENNILDFENSPKAKLKQNNNLNSQELGEMRNFLCSEQLLRDTQIINSPSNCHKKSLNITMPQSPLNQSKSPISGLRSPTSGYELYSESIFEKQPFKEFTSRKFNEMLDKENMQELIKAREQLLELRAKSEVKHMKKMLDKNKFSPTTFQNKSKQLENWVSKERNILNNTKKQIEKSWLITADTIRRTQRDIIFMQKILEKSKFNITTDVIQDQSQQQDLYYGEDILSHGQISPGNYQRILFQNSVEYNSDIIENKKQMIEESIKSDQTNQTKNQTISGRKQILLNQEKSHDKSSSQHIPGVFDQCSPMKNNVYLIDIDEVDIMPSNFSPKIEKQQKYEPEKVSLSQQNPLEIVERSDQYITPQKSGDVQNDLQKARQNIINIPKIINHDMIVRDSNEMISQKQEQLVDEIYNEVLQNLMLEIKNEKIIKKTEIFEKINQKQIDSKTIAPIKKKTSSSPKHSKLRDIDVQDGIIQYL